MKKPEYKLLYILWALLFALTAGLGLAFPAAEGAGKIALLALSVLFFAPPFVILGRAREAGERKHIRLIRFLALASLVLTVALLMLNIRCTGMGEAVGLALNAALTVVSAPMVCSNFYVVPLFLWGSLLTCTFVKK